VSIPLLVTVLDAPDEQRVATALVGLVSVALMCAGAIAVLARAASRASLDSGWDAVAALVQPGLLLTVVFLILLPASPLGMAVKAAIPLGAALALVLWLVKTIYQLIEVACECTDEGCHAPILISARVYATIQAQESRFVVFPGHEEPGVDRVVEREDSYLVVSATSTTSRTDHGTGGLGDGSRSDRPS
jgi:hypothetical protein